MKTEKNNYPVLVQEIHSEFQNAAENLLKEAKRLVKKAAKVNKGKMSRLEKLGFGKSKDVAESNKVVESATRAKENAEKVAYFSQRYPFNKFITEKQVETICKKYNLVCGGVSKYLGFVPEKNLQVIEKFRLKKEDVVYQGASTITIRDSWVNSFITSMPSDRMFWDMGRSVASIEPVVKAKKEPKKKPTKTPVGLKICAPIKDMDMSGQTVTNGYKVEQAPIPDPVVLQPVKGGYLIVTAWGDEASDESVVNQKMN